jgi:hypothetical protein
LALRDFVDTEVDRLCDNFFVSRGFAFNDGLEVFGVTSQPKGVVNLRFGAPHHEFARWDEDELHADAVFIFHRHA